MSIPANWPDADALIRNGKTRWSRCEVDSLHLIFTEG